MEEVKSLVWFSSLNEDYDICDKAIKALKNVPYTNAASALQVQCHRCALLQVFQCSGTEPLCSPSGGTSINNTMGTTPLYNLDRWCYRGEYVYHIASEDIESIRILKRCFFYYYQD